MRNIAGILKAAALGRASGGEAALIAAGEPVFGSSSAMALSPASFPSFAALADLSAIVVAMAVAYLGYNAFTYHWLSVTAESLRLGCFVALAYAVANLVRRNYALPLYLDLAGHGGRLASFWNLSFMLAALLGFLGRSPDAVSRGGFVTFYVLGLIALFIARACMVSSVRQATREGRLATARVMIVGLNEDVEAELGRGASSKAGKRVVRCVALSAHESLRRRQLAEALRFARREAIDEIVVAVPLDRADLIDLCFAAFLQAPAAVNLHVGAPAGLPGRPRAPIDRPAIRLNGNSLSAADALAKRVCDVTMASVALMLAAPLMLAIALAIKWETPGPVFFLQTRHGYNKRPFRILKFRTMTATENRRKVIQARPGDLRVTRTGRWMRRYNIDELPQLINVLRGEMSLVGPRPHAIPHDREFAGAVALYSRRHNVLPGITGWAQINGYRGIVDSVEKIERRVECDLYYIDNWSLPLDFWILAMTLFSRLAYRNAQ